MKNNTWLRIGVSVAASLIGTALATVLRNKLKTNRNIKKIGVCNCINDLECSKKTVCGQKATSNFCK